MTGLELLLAETRISVDGPPEVLDLVAVVFPTAGMSGGAAAADVALAVTASEAGWCLHRDHREIARAGGLAELAQRLEYEIEQAVIARAGRRLALHAAAVAVGDGAVLIAGRPGAGKSSTAFQLLELGHGFLADEVAVVDPGSWTVLPFPRAPALTGDYLERFAARRPLRHGAVRTLADRDWRYVPRRIRAAPAPVARLLLPRFEPGAVVVSEELSPQAALVELLEHCFAAERDEEGVFDDVIALLEAVPVERFAYGDMEAARRHLARLGSGTASGEAQR